MSVTIVTALFDIDRENKGDGRSVSEYLEWFRKTLQLNCNLFIVTEEKFHQFVIANRPKNYPTHIKIDTLSNAKYYKYLPRIKGILESEEYKKRIVHPNRVECKLPEYNIIQYSKFGWLESCIETNPFDSEYFFWMDAGLSRFFGRTDLKIFYPSNKKVKFLQNAEKKFLVQGRVKLEKYQIDEKFKWGSDNLMKGGIFGGHRSCVLEVSEMMEHRFVTEMLDQKNANNEQLCLAYVWRDNKEKFFVVENNRHPAYIFEFLK